MDKEELLQFLRDNLRIETSQSESYTGGLDGSGVLYGEDTTIKLMLGNEVISEVDL